MVDQRRLLAWFDDHGRDLPWRRTRDPWAVLVSEMMLVQTQVDRVVPKYAAFLDRFVDASSCAAAAPGEVVEHWAGLGYNRRALALHRSAARIVDVHGGEVPEALDALLALAGVGPYIARAVLAFAFEHDVGVVDTNAARILARVTGRPLRRADAQATADAWVPAGAGWAWNQAMLDLGAQICRPRRPVCDACPLQRSCTWAGRDDQADPAVGSAGTSGRQGRFEGSDRQGRGRLVDALRAGPVADDDAVLATVMGWPEDLPRARRVAEGVIADGLAVRGTAAVSKEGSGDGSGATPVGESVLRLP